MSEEQGLAKVEELLRQFDPKLAAIDTIARRYAAPWLVPENFINYAKDSGLNVLLSVPDLPIEMKKKLIISHMTAKFTEIFNGVGDPRIPSAIAEIVSENWCDKIPSDKNRDWISAINEYFGTSDRSKTEDSISERRIPHNRSQILWIIAATAVIIISICIWWL